MPDCGRGADLPLQRVWSGTDQLFYLPLQGGLRDCTQTHTGAQVRQWINVWRNTCDMCSSNDPRLNSQSGAGWEQIIKELCVATKAFGVCMCVCNKNKQCTFKWIWCKTDPTIHRKVRVRRVGTLTQFILPVAQSQLCKRLSLWVSAFCCCF